MGSEIDARQGALVVRAAGVGGMMIATFSGAVFRLGQPASGPKRGLVTAALVDGAFAGVPAYGSCHARDPRVLQTLKSKVSGRFGVRGHYSVGAAGAGTDQWDTSDRCDGTLTAVHRGSVRVARLRRHGGAVTVAAGRSYLVRR
jgi:hypothetical protein